MMIPQGTYTGRVHGIFRPLNLFWRGKVFHGDQVWNRILGGLFVEGEVETCGPFVVYIHYRSLGITDVLRQRTAGDDTIWEGSMPLGWFVVEFTLEKET